MGYFGSKATSGLCQALIALMPPHSVYIESHLGGGALMKRKPTGVRSIRIDRDAQALEAFACDYPVELVHGCAHAFLASFPFLGPVWRDNLGESPCCLIQECSRVFGPLPHQNVPFAILNHFSRCGDRLLGRHFALFAEFQMRQRTEPGERFR